MILLDLMRPEMVPWHEDNLLANLVYSGSGNLVHTVLVDGKVVVRGGEVLTMDEEEILREMQKEAPRFVELVPRVGREVLARGPHQAARLQEGGAGMIDPKVADSVLSRITERDLVELALHITSVEAPPGEEGEGAEVIYQWLAGEGFSPKRVGLFEDRFNVFAEVEGSGRGPALAFNSHIDTWMRRDDHLIWRDPGNGTTSTWAARRATS